MATVAIAVGVSIASALLTKALTPTPGASNELDDLSILKSEYGVPIPRIFGRYRVTGNVVWAKDIFFEEEIVRGDDNNIFTYFGDFAVMLCEGEVEGIGKIWLNNKLVFNPELGRDTDFFSPTVSFFNSNGLGAPTDPQTAEELQDYFRNVTLGREVRSASSEFFEDHIRFYPGSNDQPVDPTIEATEGVGTTPAFRNRCYIVFRNLPLEDYGNAVPKVEVEIVERDRDLLLSELIAGLLSQANIDPSQYRIELVNNPVVRGYSFANSGNNVRSALEDLQTVYFFQIIDDGNTLVFRDQIQELREDLPLVDFNVTTTRLFGSEPGSAFKEVRDKTEDLPSQVEVEYLNRNNDYLRGVQSRYRSTATHVNEINFKTRLVITDSEMQTTASRMISLYWSQQKKYEEVNLPVEYFNTQAGDTLQIRIRDRIRNVQVEKVVRGTNFITELTLLNSPGNLYDIVEESPIDVEYTPLETIPVLGEPVSVALDTPLVKDSDNPIGYYGTGRQENPDVPWTSGRMFVATDGGTFFNKDALGFTSTHGTLTSDLGINPSGQIIPSTSGSVIQVKIPYGTIDSATALQFSNLDFVLFIGGEMIAFENAVLTGSDADGALLYDITNYVRGLRGTEAEVKTHLAGEDIYLIAGNNPLRDYTLLPEEIGSQLEFKAVPSGFLEEAVTQITEFTPFEAKRLKPYSPTNLNISRELSTLNLTATWQRRTRIGGLWGEFTETVALSESAELYEVELYSEDGLTLLDTYATTEPKLTIDLATQITFFGSNRTSLNLRIYQISTEVGRGTPLSPGLLLFNQTT